MTLRAGDRLGPYEILTPLGSGGMGEVFKARDTRLSRDVALKTLIVEAGRDAERFRRFKKEAESTAALSHPNIVAIFDIGEERDIPYIVSELVPGGTLRDLLDRGPLPIRKLLELAAGIAEGLAAAHAAGIVHRDLKPDNVLLTSEGRAKIADFGLAKYFRAGSDPEGSQLTTLTDDRTKEGTILGTVGYMSPEQASGRPLDFRSDQFSFGSILYEMATGKRPFARGTPAQTLAAIIEDEPEPLATVNPRTPVSLRWIVERCLAKESKDRYDSTRDLARDLARLRDGISEASLSGGAAAERAPRSRIRAQLLAGAVLLFLALAILAAVRLGSRPAVESPRFRQLTFRRGLIPDARFSPDGQTIVYGAGWEGRPIELFTARPPSPDSRPLGLPPASILAISPTGEMALSMGCEFRLQGYHACIGTLARASLAGGAPRELLESVSQADWSRDGSELAVVRSVEGGHQLEFPIGHVLRKNGWIGQPRMSPRGDAIAFFEIAPFSTNGSISVVDIRTEKVKVLSSGWRYCPGLAWSPSGREVWFSAISEKDPEGGALYAVSMSGKTRIVYSGAGGMRLHDIAKDGQVLVTLDSIRARLSGLFPGDSREHDYSWFGFTIAKDLTPDGRFLLFREQGPSALQSTSAADRADTYFRKTDGSPAIPLGKIWPLTLSPDAKWVATYVHVNNALPHITLVPTGPGEPRDLPNSTLEDYEWAAWFPDGKTLSIDANERGHRGRCYAQAIDRGEAKPTTPEGTHDCLVSPDGRLILAQDDQGGTAVFPVSGSEAREMALHPGEEPLQWNADSAGLFFVTREAPSRVERLDLKTGKRELWKDLAPSDPAGVLGINEIVVVPGGRFYAYSYRLMLSDLYLVQGLK
jgi:eukaryotic-like serine/threonine-protein kinase